MNQNQNKQNNEYNKNKYINKNQIKKPKIFNIQIIKGEKLKIGEMVLYENSACKVLDIQFITSSKRTMTINYHGNEITVPIFKHIYKSILLKKFNKKPFNKKPFDKNKTYKIN